MNSRAKGSTAEREIVSILREHGYDVERSPLSGALSWKGDVIGMDYCIEVKRCERWALPAWIEQTKREAQGKRWLLMFRRSRQEWFVVMPLEQWLREGER